MNYKFLIFNNELYIFNPKNNSVNIIRNFKSIKNDKIFDINELEYELNNNGIFKKIRHELVPIKVIFYCWENYSEYDKYVYKNMFVQLNVNIIQFKKINDYLEHNTLVISFDGIHYNNLYYEYSLFNKSVIQTYNYIVNSNNLNGHILIGNLYNDIALTYENNETFFIDFLKT